MQEIDHQKPISNEDDLLLQTFISIELSKTLFQNKFENSSYFDELNFTNPYIKILLKDKGIANKGYILLNLYSLLVVPKEILKGKYDQEFENINQLCAQLFHSVQSNYAEHKKEINFLRHMRNAVSHGRVSFEEKSDDPRGSNLIFIDQRNQKKKVEKCILKIRLPKLDPILKCLKNILYLHIHNLNQSQ